VGNSTVRLIDVVDFVQNSPELEAVLPIAGYSTKRVYQTANKVMSAMLSSTYKWPWNRGGGSGLFYTNSWQQDYPQNLLDAAFLQDSTILDINNTSIPRPIFPVEAVQNIPVVSQQYGRCAQASLLTNRNMQYATWGATGVGHGNQNPHAGQVVVDPLGLGTAPNNPLLAVRDPNGNLWKLSRYGTLGDSEPTWPNPVAFPTYQKPTIAATTIDDGTAQWTALNPEGIGIRLSPLPPQTGRTYEFWPVYQMRPVPFTSMQQTLGSVPDDYSQFFIDGVIAVLWSMHPDTKLRAKHADAITLWEKSLSDAKRAGDRNRDAAIMYPSEPITTGLGSGAPTVAFPYGTPGSW
jgi:hypothetical protein